MVDPVLVRGAGDVGSAIAHALARQGWWVIIHDVPAPAHPRRGMSFADAYFIGQVNLGGLQAQHCEDLTLLRRHIADRGRVTTTALPFDMVLRGTRPQVLVDARMRKRARAEIQLGLAPLAIGIGPGFAAGSTVDLVIESARGEHLGHVIDSGEAVSTLSEPSILAGVGRERFVYSPGLGCLRTRHRIGEAVAIGDSIAMIADLSVRAPLTGEIRGLAHDGVVVETGAKVLEVIPAGSAACFGIGGRPARIAAGVLHAVADRMALRSPATTFEAQTNVR